jgi:hypothetical protein
VVALHLRLVAYVSSWLQTEGLAASTLDERTVDAIRAGAEGGRPGELLAAADAGVPASSGGGAPRRTVGLLTRYAEYLVRERGLAKETIGRNLRAARAFLADRQLGTISSFRRSPPIMSPRSCWSSRADSRVPCLAWPPCCGPC